MDNARHPLDQVAAPPHDSSPDAGQFDAPEGWTLSPNRSTSRLAFEISRTTRWYVNDGKGTGYFAPGWDSERIARRMQILIWIGVALAGMVLGVSGYHIHQQYAEQINYTQLRNDGALVPATVQSIAVKHSTDRYSPTGAQNGWDYITETSATIEYVVDGRTLQGEINDHDHQKKDFPAPAWSPGETVQMYADPESPERFVLLHDYKEEDAGSMPRAAILILAFTGGVLIIPAVFIIFGTRKVREARKL